MLRRRLLLVPLLAVAIASASGAWYAGFDVRARAEAASLGPYWVLAFAAEDASEAARGLAELERDLQSLHLTPAALYVRPVDAQFEGGALLHEGDALAVGKLVRDAGYEFKRLYFTGAHVTLPNRGRLSLYAADRRALAALSPRAAGRQNTRAALVRIIAPDNVTYALASTAVPGELTP